MSQYLILFATFGDIKSAKEVADKLLSDRLVACVQFEKIESMYIYNNSFKLSGALL
ncbi:MAG: divalent cation tolerance protein CutA [Campylobacterota bacterium]